MSTVTVTPQVGQPIVFTDVGISNYRAKQPFQAVQGYGSQEQVILRITRYARARLPELAAIAATRVQQQVNRANVYQVISASPAQLVVVTFDTLDRTQTPAATLTETVCGALAIGDATVEGYNESLSLIIYKCNRLITPAGVQTRGL